MMIEKISDDRLNELILIEEEYVEEWQDIWAEYHDDWMAEHIEKYSIYKELAELRKL